MSLYIDLRNVYRNLFNLYVTHVGCLFSAPPSYDAVIKMQPTQVDADIPLYVLPVTSASLGHERVMVHTSSTRKQRSFNGYITSF